MFKYHNSIRPYLIEAGQLALRSFLKTKSIYKKDGSPLTQADLDADKILQKGIKTHFPNMIIESEEGESPSQKTRRWLIDPIDGTSAFTEGLAHWGPTLGVIDAQGQPKYGSLYLPRLEEEWYAEENQGAFVDHQRLPQLTHQPLTNNSVLYIPSKLHNYAKVNWPGKMRNLGSIAVHLCYVAGGRAQAAVIPNGCSSWDIIAGLTLLKEVGGKIWSPQPFSINATRKSFFIACSPSAFEWFQSKNQIQSPYLQNSMQKNA